jgi:hypothetical protein
MTTLQEAPKKDQEDKKKKKSHTLAGKAVDYAKEQLGKEKNQTVKGAALIKLLGLEDIKHIWVHKILNIANHVLIITFDSSKPKNYLSISKIKSAKSNRVLRLKCVNSVPHDVDKWKQTVPVPLHSWQGLSPTGTVLVVNDLAGQYKTRITESQQEFEVEVV